jgi:CelD/BcsL family acetyltransferase involved in cellulose biosynthesis
MHVEAHFESGGFAALRPEWNQLLRESCCDTIFLTWQWQTTWWKHLGDGGLLLLGFRSGDGRLVGLAPLYYDNCDPQKRVIRMIGCRDVSDYLDLIIARGHEEAVYRRFVSYLSREAEPWDVLDLCNIPQASQTFVLLQAMAEAEGYQTLVEIEDVCPIIPLPATWDEYLMMLDKKQRHEVRRKLRRAEDAGSRFLIVGPNDDLRAEMATFIELHQKSTPEKDAFMDPQMQGFFLDVTQAAHQEGWLQLAFVEMEGERSASLLNFDYNNGILVYNSGYDPASFRHLSPGIVVTAQCIENAITLGRDRFDFLRGGEEYKYRFGAQDTRVRRLLIVRPGVSLEAIC